VTSAARSKAIRTSRRRLRCRWRRLPDPVPAAAPARLEAVLLPCPETECIGKGNASAPCEFGLKVSIVTTNARAPGGQFVLHARALPGKPDSANGFDDEY
jgi:hypothetical protein